MNESKPPYYSHLIIATDETFLKPKKRTTMQDKKLKALQIMEMISIKESGLKLLQENNIGLIQKQNQTVWILAKGAIIQIPFNSQNAVTWNNNEMTINVLEKGKQSTVPQSKQILFCDDKDSINYGTIMCKPKHQLLRRKMNGSEYLVFDME